MRNNLFITVRNPKGTPQSSAPTPDSIFPKIENLIKLVGFAVSLIAAFGYPAIYVQLRRFDLPLHVVDYKNVLAAGVIPAIISFAFCLYGYWFYKETHQRKEIGNFRSVLFLVLLGSPLFFVIVPAVMFMYVYYIFWFLLRLFTLFFYKPSELTLFNITMITFGVAIIATIVWAIRDNKGKKKPAQVKSESISPGSEGEAPKPEKKREPGNIQTKLIESIFFLVFAAACMFYLGYLSVVHIIEIRFIQYFSNFQEFKKILLILILITAILYTAGMLFSSIKSIKLAKRLFFLFNVMVVLALIYFYSVHWYAKVDSRLGGGKLTRVNLWVNTTGLPKEFSKQFTNSTTADSSQVTNWEKGLLLFENDRQIILADKDSSWLIISKELIVAYERP